MRTLLILAVAVSLFGVGCKKKASSASATAADTGGGGGGVGAGTTNYEPGGGAITNTRRAADRTAALNDFHQLGQLIEVQYNDLGKMPNAQQIKANLTQAQNILEHINDGRIILTGTMDHGGLWAYQKDADTSPGGGIVLQAGSARRATKEEVLRLLGR